MVQIARLTPIGDEKINFESAKKLAFFMLLSAFFR